ncbi:U8 snoRNA-decapping enzyme-like [Daktulosphaira vitifoliae]|uniref:U8 snoRNA-decapping enzyme-like n=1 Tax=Daktulosphaira vitifoliae TaxID=58002 RepID=UPI0021A9D6C0|nr:U8 snoRNA-decapping enzyme-like [Daktulosphaira vitifoliae]
MNEEESLLVQNIFEQYNLTWENDQKILIDKDVEKSNEKCQPICFVPNCKTSKEFPLYHFPSKNKELLYIWIQRVGLSTIYDEGIYTTLTICKKHFDEKCFEEENHQLKLNAIPSLNLIDYTGPPENCFAIPSTSNKDLMIMSTRTGDCTWGWLLSTEEFGRETEFNEFIPLSEQEINKAEYKSLTNAAHCMIYAENDEMLFGIYKIRASILMQLRYDGYFGFPGGLIDAGEDNVTAVNRELKEEMNLDISKHEVKNNDHIISHWSKERKLVVHFYKLKVSITELLEIEKRALLAKDYGNEVLGTVRVPLYTMGDKYRGFPLFLNHKFIGNSHDQLLAALVHLNIFTAEEVKSVSSASKGNK